MLTAIRNNDPKLKEGDKPIFEDDDFERGGKGERKKDKAFTLKDQIRTQALEKMKKGDSSSGSGDEDDDESGNEDDRDEKRRAKESKLF